MQSYAQRQLASDTSWRPLLAAYIEAEEVLTAERDAAESDVEKSEGEDSDATADIDDIEGSEGSDTPETETTEGARRKSIWVPRIDSVEGTKDEHLPRLHGRLIAFGLLKFQLSSPVTGVEYRVTPLGRSMLEQVAEESEAVESPAREAA